MVKAAKKWLTGAYVFTVIVSLANVWCLTEKDTIPLISSDDKTVDAALRYGILLVSASLKAIAALLMMGLYYNKNTKNALASGYTGANALTALFNSTCHVKENNSKLCGITFFLYMFLSFFFVIAAVVAMLILSSPWDKGTVSTTTTTYDSAPCGTDNTCGTGDNLGFCVSVTNGVEARVQDSNGDDIACTETEDTTTKIKDWSTEENYEEVYSLEAISNAILFFLFVWFMFVH